MKKMKQLLGLALGCAALSGQIQANESWEWSDGSNGFGYGDGCYENKILLLEEFLYWTPGTYFPFVNNTFTNDGAAITSPTAPFTSTTDTFNDPYVRVSDKWSPGVRFGLGWESGEGNWQIWGIWTGYTNYARRVITSTPPAPLSLAGGSANFGDLRSPVTGDVLPVAGGGIGSKATGTYKLNYNVADLVFSRPFDLCEGIHLAPFAGVRAAFIHQRSALKLEGISTPVGFSGILAATGSNNRMDQQQWAVGPRLGVEAVWGDWHGFNLMGNISAAVLYGRFEETVSTSGYSGATTGDFRIPSITTLNIRSQDNYSQVVPNLQVQLGFGYNFEIELNFTPYSIDFFALWEGNTYWGASNRLLFEKALHLTGLTTGIAVSF